MFNKTQLRLHEMKKKNQFINDDFTEEVPAEELEQKDEFHSPETSGLSDLSDTPQVFECKEPPRPKMGVEGSGVTSVGTAFGKVTAAEQEKLDGLYDSINRLNNPPVRKFKRNKYAEMEAGDLKEMQKKGPGFGAAKKKPPRSKIAQLNESINNLPEDE